MKHPDSDTVAAALARVDLVEEWCKAVRAKAAALLHDGYDLPGYKLVRGKRGNRAWGDEATAEALLVSALGDAVWTRKVVSPAQAEKLLKKKDLTLEGFGLTITQSEGAAHVAPAGDPRPAIDAGSAAGEFNDETGE
jgi:hypothetical protein